MRFENSKPNDKVLRAKFGQGGLSEHLTIFRCVEKMESVFGKAREHSAMQRFSHSGMALLPWTRHILAVLWENVRLMLHVICCSLMAGKQFLDKVRALELLG